MALKGLSARQNTSMISAKSNSDLNLVLPAVTGRFSPSPTGRQHAGNIFAALIAWLEAKSTQGRMVLRIENLDKDRSKPEYIDLIQRDLEALGLFWDEGPYFQSDRTAAYEEAFATLEKKGLLYPCFCTRADLHAASAPHSGELAWYDSTCSDLSCEEREIRAQRRVASTRIVVGHETICFHDALQGDFSQNLAQDCGDFIIKRADGGFAYQLAVVLDDAWQNITSVVRGSDLLDSTPRQIYLQQLFGFEQPQYCHIPLIIDESGKRLSKRNRDAEMDALLKRFKTPQGILGHIAYLAGLIDEDGEVSAQELLACYSRESLKNTPSIVWK